MPWLSTTFKDVIVVVERTGRYHRLVQRAFTKAGFEVRILHPFATKQFRQPADPGNKTDDTDLSAIHRAAVNGFGLSEHEPDPLFVRLQLLARHRRNLVRKKVAIQQKMLEHLESYHARIFPVLSTTSSIPTIALWVARNLGSAEAIVEAGVIDLVRRLSQAGIRKNTPTVEKIVAWARSAPSPRNRHHSIAVSSLELDADRVSKLRSIRAIEGELAEQLVLTPYVLLLGIPGINVVSAAEFAGEAGPIERYRKCPSHLRPGRACTLRGTKATRSTVATAS